MRWSLGLFHCWIIHYYFIPIYVVSCDIMHPARTLKKYRFDTTSVGIKIIRYPLRERQICIGEGQDFGSIPHAAYKKAAHHHTYWKHPGVCLLSLCWFTMPSSGWSIAVVWSVFIGSQAHCGRFDIDCFSCGHVHLLSSASDTMITMIGIKHHGKTLHI